MSSPIKRRKKNDYQSGPSGKNLDFFFAKQKETNQATVTDIPSATVSQSDFGPGIAEAGLSLTDEEVAKKLHEELNGVNLENSSQAPTEVRSEERVNEKQAHLETSPCIDGARESPKAELSDAGAHRRIGLTSPTKVAKETLSLQSTVAEQNNKSINIPFDESCLTFNPQNYVLDLHREWATQGGDATYALLTQCFILVSSTQSRIKIVNILVNFVRTLIEGDPGSLLPAVRASILFDDHPR